jgi:hypothetical protein
LLTFTSSDAKKFMGGFSLDLDIAAARTIALRTKDSFACPIGLDACGGAHHRVFVHPAGIRSSRLHRTLRRQQQEQRG